MKKVKIQIINLEISGYESKLKIKKIKKIKSSIFEIVEIKPFQLNLNESEIFNYKSYLIDQNENILNIIISPIDRNDNYFTYPLSKNNIYINSNDIFEYTEGTDVTPENFLLRFIYGFCLIYQYYGFAPDNVKITQNDGLFSTKKEDMEGCLMDLSSNKNYILLFFNNPHISKRAKIILKKNISKITINQFEKEIINKFIPLTIRVKNFVNKNKILSIIISFLIALFINILANICTSLFHFFMMHR